jgi:hypothetical protein
MALAVAAVTALLRQAQDYTSSQLHAQLEQAAQALEPLAQLDAGSTAAAAVQLRGISGALQGAAVLFTELARAAAATSHALEGNSVALAANGAAVISSGGARPQLAPAPWAPWGLRAGSQRMARRLPAAAAPLLPHCCPSSSSSASAAAGAATPG